MCSERFFSNATLGQYRILRFGDTSPAPLIPPRFRGRSLPSGSMPCLMQPSPNNAWAAAGPVSAVRRQRLNAFRSCLRARPNTCLIGRSHSTISPFESASNKLRLELAAALTGSRRAGPHPINSSKKNSSTALRIVRLEKY